jgi:hypothetical protein
MPKVRRVTDFPSPFLLRMPNGWRIPGAEFPTGQAVVLDDDVFGLLSGAESLELLLLGYIGATVERPASTPTEEP